ncbi:MAG: chromosome segregation protein SMC [Candidatus Parabeggiatoa sp. nov. 2]|nr:MAG: chromosome segregation protein SMC [Beggiatoa sp. 4572_84]RKZ57227.1 MAG: chromosome segregation protein SMC [Gammaproteobacteria bacterium]
MITHLTLHNFKSLSGQTYEFAQFDLLVGRNNSGKSTILQALAIWQFCLDEFRRAKRRDKKSIQIVLPNFTALPLPEFNLLWKERTERHYPVKKGKKNKNVSAVEIKVTWIAHNGKSYTLAMNLRYASPQTIYAIPVGGWENFQQLVKNNCLPIIAYVPPFSGLEDNEEWRDDAPLRKQVGKAQPGSVLRNLLLRVWENNPQDWQEIQQLTTDWFSVELKPPQYEKGVDTQIICEYKQSKKSYDIIAGGSGFHQTLTLLAFLYGYQPTTILLDEPDAHLHVNLQRDVLEYFKFFNQKSQDKNIQFLIATHAEEFIKAVEVSQIISLLSSAPQRVQSTPAILTAMAEVSNLEVTQLIDSPVMLYVEGEDDERLLHNWAKVLNTEESLDKVCFHMMGGGLKQSMKQNADRHFAGIKQIIPDARRLLLFDYDDEDTFHPQPDNPVLYEWQRKNIDNYLLVPAAWIRAAGQKIQTGEKPKFFKTIEELIQDFFASENLTLPPNQTWQHVKANIFQVVDGKKLLFKKPDCLFQRVQEKFQLKLTRSTIAANMTAEEIHEDVHQFFAKLNQILKGIGNG